MTRDEYEHRKRRLEEQLEEGIEFLKAGFRRQLQEGIELLRAGFRQQLRALDLLFMGEVLPSAPAEASHEEPAAVPVPAAPQLAESSRPRQKRGQLWTDIDAVLDDLPDVFNRHDLVKALGYEPDPSALHRVIHGLLRRGVIVIKYRSHGKIPAVYEFVVEEEEDDAAAAAEVGEEKLPAS